MSFYCTVQGEVSYPDDESFNSVLDTLRKGGWVDDEGFFLDECENRIREKPEDDRDYFPDVDVNAKVISIPCAHYRNLSRVEFFIKDGEGYKGRGTVLMTSTDGCFQGYEIVDGVETVHDLEDWAKENLEGDDAVAPKEEDYDDHDDYFQNLVDWQQNVEMEFHSDI